MNPRLWITPPNTGADDLKCRDPVVRGIAMLYHGVALIITSCTTSGSFGIGFTGDRDGLPHLQRLAVYTGEALEELERALQLTS